MTVSGASNRSMTTCCSRSAPACDLSSVFLPASSLSSPGGIVTRSPCRRTSETCRGSFMRSPSEPRISNRSIAMIGGTSVRPLCRIVTPRPLTDTRGKTCPSSVSIVTSLSSSSVRSSMTRALSVAERMGIDSPIRMSTSASTPTSGSQDPEALSERQLFVHIEHCALDKKQTRGQHRKRFSATSGESRTW